MIESNHFLALLELATTFAADKKEYRQYLQDVLVKPVDKDTHIVACNGHTMIKITVSDYLTVLPERLTTGSIKDAAKVNNSVMLFPPAPDRMSLQYPDYERLMPSTTDTMINDRTLPLLNAVYLAEAMTALVKCSKKIKSHKEKFGAAIDFTHISDVGSNLFTCKLNDEIKIEIIIMPMRK